MTTDYLTHDGLPTTELPSTCSEVDFLMTSTEAEEDKPGLAALAPATSLIELRVLVNQVFEEAAGLGSCDKFFLSN